MPSQDAPIRGTQKTPPPRAPLALPQSTQAKYRFRPLSPKSSCRALEQALPLPSAFAGRGLERLRKELPQLAAIRLKRHGWCSHELAEAQGFPLFTARLA